MKRKYDEGGEVQEIQLIAHRTKLDTGRRDAEQPDRTESVLKMDSDERDQQNDCGGYNGPDYESPEQKSQSTEKLRADGQPCRDVWQRHAHLLQDPSKCIRTSGQL